MSERKRTHLIANGAGIRLRNFNGDASGSDRSEPIDLGFLRKPMGELDGARSAGDLVRSLDVHPYVERVVPGRRRSEWLVDGLRRADELADGGGE